MSRLSLLLALLIVALLPINSSYAADESRLPGFRPPLDMGEAEELCNSLPLMTPEGIWRYDDFNIDVLIIRDTMEASSFGLWIVESQNCALNPGMRFGTLSSSAQKGKYSLKIFTSIKKGTLSGLKPTVATYSEKDETLFIDTSKLKFSFNPFGLLPNSIRRTFRLTEQNPKTSLKSGLRKVFPSYDGNGNNRRQPIYL